MSDEETINNELNESETLIIKKISSHIGVPIIPTNFTQFEKFEGETLHVNMFPIKEVTNLTIDNKPIQDFIVDNQAGLIYFNQNYTGFLKLEYTACLTDEEYSLYIEPLVKDMIEYENDSGWTKNASSIREGDISISLDTSIGKGALIQKKLDNLKNMFNTYARMI